MADIASALRSWSANAASNNPLGSTPIGTGLDDNLRQIQATVRQYLASKGSTIGSNATVNLAAADGYFIDINGTTTTTSFGTEGAGISYWLRYNGGGTWTLTYNATSMILPASVDLVLSPGDVIRMTSLGSGNWVCTAYLPRGGLVTVAGTQTLTNKTLTAPTINTATLLNPTVTGTLTAAAATLSGILTVNNNIVGGGTLTGITNITASGSISGATCTGGWIASVAEVKAATINNKFVTPAGLAVTANLVAAGGYYPLPGGLTMKWGQFTANGNSTTTVSFPAGAGGAFNTGCFHVDVMGCVTTSNDDNFPNVIRSSITASNFQVYCDYGANVDCTFFAIGV
jgi:hypothetical protein